MQKILPWLQLFRLPNVFTAIADVLMGFLFINLGYQPVQWLIPLIVSTCCLYSAGMVLNDVFDVEVDREERPQRPLPSGKISVSLARNVGFGLLAAGIASAFLAGVTSGVVAIVLAVVIYVYDGVAKKTPIAPVVMGSCRFFNVLLGMSCAAPFLQPDQLLVAGGLGTYVAGITWFARCEAKDSNRNLLTLGLVVMAVGISLLGLLPWFTERRLLLRTEMIWPTLLVLLMISVVRRCVMAISNPTPANVQNAVKHSIFSLVVLDAAVVLATCGPFHAVAVVALLIPTIFLGKWVYST